MSSPEPPFPTQPILTYLNLPPDYTPSPQHDPIAFLHTHIRALPPHLLLPFSALTTPHQRAAVPAVRNRRLRHAERRPPALAPPAARATWALLWPGREPRGREERADEERWARTDFMGGASTHVGKLGGLLGEYEEEREAERVRVLRRMYAESVSVEEEEEESDEEEEEEERDTAPPAEEEMSPADAEAAFERLIRERFIYGLLDSIDYDAVDWNEALDGGEDEREAEERWFEDDEDETMADELQRSDVYDY